MISSKSKLMIGTYRAIGRFRSVGMSVGEVHVEADDEAHDRHHRPFDRREALDALVVFEVSISERS